MTGHISDDGLLREETVAEHTEKTVYLCHEKGRRCGNTALNKPRPGVELAR